MFQFILAIFRNFFIAFTYVNYLQPNLSFYLAPMRPLTFYLIWKQGHEKIPPSQGCPLICFHSLPISHLTYMGLFYIPDTSLSY
jgi:hypothetical protein